MKKVKKSFLKKSLLFLTIVAISFAMSPVVSNADQCSDTTVAIYRAFSPSNTDHFYTRVASEVNSAWQMEGIAFYAFDNSRISATVPVYRLWNGNTVGDHFYTTSATERDGAVTTLGYTYEGVGFHAFNTQVAGSVPVYRLYNSAVFDHLYTTSVTEKNNAINTLGYVNEGVAFYAFDNQASMDNGSCVITGPTPPPATASVTVISPNGGEQWKIGETHTITWTSNGFASNSTAQILLIDYSNNSSMTIANTTNDGSHSWTIPTTLGSGVPLGNGNVYKVEVTVRDNSGKAEYDRSNNNFSITTQTVTLPAPTPLPVPVPPTPQPTCYPSAPVVTCASGVAPTWTNTKVSDTFANQYITGRGNVFDQANANLQVQPGDKVFLTAYAIGSQTPVCHYTDDALDISTSQNGQLTKNYFVSGCTDAIHPTDPLDVTSQFLSGVTGSQNVSSSFTFRDVCGANISHTPYYLNVARCATVLPPLTASCTASANPVSVNQTVTFSPVNVSGTGANTTFHWSAGCNGNTQNCVTSFSTPGTYQAVLTVTSDNRTATASCPVTVNSPVVTTYQCSDGIDNDNDGAIDYPADFSCSGTTDNDETNPKAQCQDGIDNDGDGLIDYPQDTGCTNKQDNNEFNAAIVCSNNSQCGTDGYTGSPICRNSNIWQDYTTNTCVNAGTTSSRCDIVTTSQQKSVCGSNQTCSGGSCVTNTQNLAASCVASPNPATTGQSVTFNPTAVSGGIGNYQYQWSAACSGNSQSCSTSFSNSGVYGAILRVTSGTQQVTTSCSVNVNQVVATPQCSDGIDNDNDGAIDYPADFSCSGTTDNDETNPKAQCQDGIDNDGDGLIDYPQDTGCTNKQDNNEFNAAITCSTNAQCGTNTLVGSAFCQDGNVYQQYKTYTCNNAGTITSTCSDSTAPQFQSNCNSGQTCSGGTCGNNPATLVASCSLSANTVNASQSVTFNGSATGGSGSYTYQWSAGCNAFNQNCTNTFSSGGSYTGLLKVTSGTQTAFANCSVTVNSAATTPVCTTNSQCGTNTLVGDSFCNGTGVYRNYKTFTCNNAGTATASCSDSTAPQLQNTCSGTCSGAGICGNVNIVCSSDSQCGGSGYTGSGYCNGNTVWQNYTTNTCINAGTTSSFCSPSTSPRQGQTCGYNQTCSFGTCIYNNNPPINTCISHSYQQCLNGSVHWFNSCGNDEGISQACNGNQTCSGNTCINQYQNQGYIQMTETVRNLSSGNLGYGNSVNAAPSNIVQFNIVITTSGSQNLNNITVRDTLPANLIYNNNLTLDGVANSGSIMNGLYLGSLYPGQSRTITFQAQVAGAQNFVFGTTTLTDAVYANSTDGSSNSANTSASVIVTKSGVLGATSVSTGLLKGNFWLDSFLAPLALGLAGLWGWKSGFLGNLAFTGFIQNRRKSKEEELDPNVKYF